MVRISQATTFLFGCFFSVFTVWLSMLLFGMHPSVVLQMLLYSLQWVKQKWHSYAHPVQQQQKSEPPDPDAGSRVAPRCRKKAKRPWYVSWWRRLQSSSPHTGSQQRRAKRLEHNAERRSRSNNRRPTGAVVLETLGLKVLWPLLLLSLLMLTSSALAAPFTTPSSMVGLQLTTGTLAAWEFSRLGRYRFWGYCYLP
jgi:hypothetical protein